MHVVRKCLGQVLMATSTMGLTPSCLFFVTDHSSGLCFLFNTGAEVSVILGADFIGRLIDSFTRLQVNGVSPSPSVPHPPITDPFTAPFTAPFTRPFTAPFTASLQEFPSLSSRCPSIVPSSTPSLVRFSTTGPQVHAHSCPSSLTTTGMPSCSLSEV